MIDLGTDTVTGRLDTLVSVTCLRGDSVTNYFGTPVPGAILGSGYLGGRMLLSDRLDVHDLKLGTHDSVPDMCDFSPSVPTIPRIPRLGVRSHRSSVLYLSFF